MNNISPFDGNNNKNKFPLSPLVGSTMSPIFSPSSHIHSPSPKKIAKGEEFTFKVNKVNSVPYNKNPTEDDLLDKTIKLKQIMSNFIKEKEIDL